MNKPGPPTLGTSEGGTTVSAGDDRRQVEASLREEVEHLGRIVDQQERTIVSLNRELELHTRAMGWRLQQRLIPVRRAMLSLPVLRQVYRIFYRALEIWTDEGFLRIFGRVGDKVKLALQGRNFLVVEHDPRPEDEYQRWLRRHGAPPSDRDMQGEMAQFRSRPLVSVLVRLDRFDRDCVVQALATLTRQSYDRWELCVAVPGGELRQGESEVPSINDGRVRLVESLEGAPSYADALRAASGELVGVLGAGDDLAPEALFELVRRFNEQPDADLIYSDEDWVADSGQREDPLFKPDWSPDLLLSTNYLERFGVFRRQAVERAGGFRASAGHGELYDLVLRLSEHTDRIVHVPKVLYHSRRQTPTADVVLRRHTANRDECRVIGDALQRRGVQGRTSAVFARRGPRCYATRFDLRQQPLVSIVIPTRDRQPLLETTLESIWRKTDYDRYEIIIVDNQSTDADTVRYLESLRSRCQIVQWSKPFNYSAINNFGVQHARGDQLLFLNNDVEVVTADWLTAMLEHAQRPEVGAVGARLLYADGRIQHAGVVVGINRVAANAFRTWAGETIGNARLADLTRNCSAVTGACMMVPRRVFDEVGGFDEALRVVLNDVDLCLKIRRRGYLVVYTPHATLYHHEGSSRGRLHPEDDDRGFEARWREFLDRGDPYYNPNLTDTHDDWRLKD